MKLQYLQWLLLSFSIIISQKKRITNRMITMTWISVKDRMPDSCRTVILWVQDASGFYKKGTTFAFLYDDNEWVILEKGKFEDPIISHWMELPEGPKDEDKKNRDGQTS